MSRKGENPYYFFNFTIHTEIEGGGVKTTIMEDFNHRQNKRHTGD